LKSGKLTATAKKGEQKLTIEFTNDAYKENEYDPTYDVRGVQAFTSLGLAGRAPVVFIQDPTINRVPPPGLLDKAAQKGEGERRRR